jgi:hypothetical protein
MSVFCGVSLLLFKETTEGFGLLDQLQHAWRPAGIRKGEEPGSRMMRAGLEVTARA